MLLSPKDHLSAADPGWKRYSGIISPFIVSIMRKIVLNSIRIYLLNPCAKRHYNISARCADARRIGAIMIIHNILHAHTQAEVIVNPVGGLKVKCIPGRSAVCCVQMRFMLFRG